MKIVKAKQLHEQAEKMSQEQPRRRPLEPIKYGDVFQVSGDLAQKPVAPQDAALMQTAETTVFGQTQKGGPAAAMQAAATINERAGFVGHGDAAAVGRDRGVTVTATDYPGTRVITESVAGQVVGQFAAPIPIQQGTQGVVDVQQQAAITIGEALEVSARTVGNKPMEQSDAAAIQAAEARATGSNLLAPGGLAAQAQSAASMNIATKNDEDKVKLGDVLTDATFKLPADKLVTREDAEGVFGAEARNNPNLRAHPAGVAASLAVAAKINEKVP